MATLTAPKRASARTTTKKVAAVKKTAMLDYVFPDGTKFTGTLKQLETVAAALGHRIDLDVAPRGYYKSESKGIVKISEMNDFHIRRALLKRSKDYYTEVFKADDTNAQFLKKYTGLTEDAVVIDLFTELSKRK